MELLEMRNNNIINLTINYHIQHEKYIHGYFIIFYPKFRLLPYFNNSE